MVYSLSKKERVKVVTLLSSNVAKIIDSLSNELGISKEKLVKAIAEVVSDYLDTVLSRSDEFTEITGSKFKRFILALDELLRLGDITNDFVDELRKRLGISDGLILEDMGWSNDLSSFWTYFTLSSKKFRWVDDVYMEFRSDGSLVCEFTVLVAFTERLSGKVEDFISKLGDVLRRADRWSTFRELKKNLEACGEVDAELGIERDEFSINILLRLRLSKWLCIPALDPINNLFKTIIVRGGFKNMRYEVVK